MMTIRRNCARTMTVLFAAGLLAATATAQPAPSDPPRQPDAARPPLPVEAPVAQPAPPRPAPETPPAAQAQPTVATPPAPAARLPAPATGAQPAPSATGSSAGPPVCCAAPAQSDVWNAKDYATVIGSVAGLLAFFVGLGAIWSNLRSTRNNNNQKTNEGELKSIEEKLDGFYGPYLQLSNTNKLLADELKSRHRNVPDMRILLLLLDPELRGRLSRGDTTIVNEIIDIDTKLLALIQENSGMVDASVQPYLYRAAAHFRMMIRAHESKLDNEPARYSSYVYPRQLDRVIQLEVDRLKARISLLRSRPMTQHPPMEPLAIPAELALDPWPA